MAAGRMVMNGTDIVQQTTSIVCSAQRQPPLVVQLIHRLAVGGLENGLVNLINYTPEERYRHAIVCLTDYSDFRQRIRRADVPVIALQKHAGQDFGLYTRLWRVLRHLRPDIVHTRNLPALECLAVAALARVPGRIHGEHGRDMYDLDGSNFKYNLLRKAMRPLVHRYIAVSTDLAAWLVHTVGVRSARVTQLHNGVDLQRFHPRTGAGPSLGPEGFAPPGTLVLGTIGRMETVKDQPTLVRAFLHLLAAEPEARKRVRVVMIGDGPLRGESQKLLRAADAEHLAWLPGERTDIPEMMRALDLFVLPSLREGISNTILEAMASGLPVVATRVGGNPELVVEGETGMLVPPLDPVALAAAIRRYLVDGDLLTRHGQAGRRKAEGRFSIEAMVNGYLNVYDEVLNAKGRGERARSHMCMASQRS
jgi:sugar transferase (PEP-CTERM/EpsH1 system associated)